MKHIHHENHEFHSKHFLHLKYFQIFILSVSGEECYNTQIFLICKTTQEDKQRRFTKQISYFVSSLGPTSHIMAYDAKKQNMIAKNSILLLFTSQT